ncbi:hypothetical protein [Streptomyces sp. NPDC058155]|uniref:hypothetical protein n=1 Tax=Streptomyces sp. NPDC058155 TaxID=3346359 RepID=UPI0036EDCFA2
MIDERKLARGRFNIALTPDGSFGEFERITKRAALVSDTLLLSHDGVGLFHELGRRGQYETLPRPSERRERFLAENPEALDFFGEAPAPDDPIREAWYGMNCPELRGLGRWILDSEQLLKSGLAWYLPSYTTGERNGVRSDLRLNHDSNKYELRGPLYRLEEHRRRSALLVRDGRAVESSGVEPVKSHLVRHVLSIELPFIEGVDLRTFSEVTAQEFASYSAFRDFLRIRFLELDESLNSTQSDREILKLGLEIKDEIRSVRSEMNTARRKRAVAVTGAGIGSVSAVLVAVYGPAFQEALAAVGASGGLWGVLHAATDNGVRDLRENKWYYVWALARKSNTHII